MTSEPQTLAGPTSALASEAHRNLGLPQEAFVCTTPAFAEGLLLCRKPWVTTRAVCLQGFTSTHLWLKPTGPGRAPKAGSQHAVRLRCGEHGQIRARVEMVGPQAQGLWQLRLVRPGRSTLAVLGLCALSKAQGSIHTVNPQVLRNRGFGPVDASRCMTFSELGSAAQMAEVKLLRYAVFKESALLKPSQQDPEDTQDERDARSSIMLGHYRGELVASCRAYAMQASDAYEFDAWCSDTHLLPAKEWCVELGRAAIALPFRNAGIPLTLMRMLTATTMASGRRYMVLGTTPALVPFYQCFGFEVTPLRFPYPGRDDFLAHVLVADVHSLWRGDSGNPLIWYALFGSLPASSAKGFYAPRGAKDAVRLGVLRRMGPLSRSVRQWLALTHRFRGQGNKP